MTRKILTAADIPEVEYKCHCGGDAKECRYALLCESCRHPCKKEPPELYCLRDPQKRLRSQIDYAKFRRSHRRCFSCIYMKAVFIDVVCTNPEMKHKVPKGEK